MKGYTQKEIINKAMTYTGAWVGSAYDRTKSENLESYIKLCFQIARKMKETGCRCNVSYKDKKIKATSKELDELQLLGITYILENKKFLKNRCRELLDNKI